MRTFTSLLAAAAILASVPSASAQDDTIRFSSAKGVREEKGKVLGLNVKEIIYEKDAGGASIKMNEKAKDVLDIDFAPDNTPFEFQNARKAMQDFAFKDAADRFERIKRSPQTSEPVKEYCRKYAVECLLQAGDPDGAYAAAEQIRKEKPDSFFLRESFLLQYEAAKAKGDAKLQAEVVKKFGDAIKEQGATEWNKNLEMLSADSAEESKDFAAALKIYQKLAADKSDPRVAEASTLGVLRCLTAQKALPDLKARSDALIAEWEGKKNAPARLLLAAYVGRGDCLLAEGKIKESLLDYMWGLLNVAPRIGEYTREHEAVLAKSSIACARYAKQFGERDKENKTLYVHRSRELLGELMGTYPRSGFKKDVEDAIKDAEKSQ